MTFEDMIEGVKKCPITIIRTDSENYLEVVVRVDKLDLFYPVLEDFFGKISKPAGEDPHASAEQLTNDFGGVRRDQTLYDREVDGVMHLAMIWPWMDNVSATIKIYRLRHTGEEGKDNSTNPEIA